MFSATLPNQWSLSPTIILARVENQPSPITGVKFASVGVRSSFAQTRIATGTVRMDESIELEIFTDYV